jgi:hypothetical protein
MLQVFLEGVLPQLRGRTYRSGVPAEKRKKNGGLAGRPPLGLWLKARSHLSIKCHFLLAGP